MKSRSGKVNIEINGLMILLIGVFVILPIVGVISEKNEPRNQDNERTQKVVIKKSSKSSFMEVSDNSGVAEINAKVKITLVKDTVRVVIIDPDKEETKFSAINSKYIETVFPQEGDWELNMYDKNGLLKEWIKISVY